jgi:Pyruvate/2-oxoacid:ferredoxin oxidoreductase delta subunit/mono/diheme cytochrome c family protein
VSRSGDGRHEQVRFGSLLTGLEDATNRAESPIRRFVGSNRLNPLPHAGTISVFLLIVVVVTGLYVTLFFEFGYEASYSSVVGLEGHPIQRAMRSIHRVSSAMLVVTTIVHGWRTFVAKRFTSSRRFRWLTGMLALVVVWLAGVTGYWLIWDVRAQAITETLAALVSPIWPSAQVAAASPSGSGWLTIFVIWLAHLGLTGIIGWALWRHLRAARFDWLPPYRWMWAMGLAVVVAGIAFPSGLIAAADPASAPTDLILDPFVMFLLPVLVSPWGPFLASAAILVVVVASALPWAVRRQDPPTAVISEAACTGCELCVVDCPYLALSMTADGSLAIVDQERCVGCGICLGSCAFGAISGLGDVVLADGANDADVIVVCSRELRLTRMPSDVTVKEVECTGAINPLAVGEVAKRGGSVHVIGCAPGECSYRTGNVLASSRMTGARQPMVPRKWQPGVTRDWAAPDDIRDLIDHPGSHGEADVDSAPLGRGPLTRMATVVIVSVLLVGAASASIGFESPTDDATVRIVVDHRAGALIEGGVDIGGDPLGITVESGGRVLETVDLGVRDHYLEVIDIAIPPGQNEIVARLDSGTSLQLFDGSISLDPGERLVLTLFDAPASPAATLGQEIFEGAGMSAQAGCEICHSVEPDRVLVGPSLAGVADRAATQVEGQSAADYLRTSILDPDAFVVEGYRAGQMLPIYEEQLSPEEIDALVEYLLSLGGPS